MNTEILNALVDIVKQGGSYALWGIFIWFFMGILKIATVGGIIWACIRLLVQSVQSYQTLRFVSRKDTIPILSKSVSKHLLGAIKDYQDSTTQAMKEFIEQAKSLLKKSSEKTKETVSPKN